MKWTVVLPKGRWMGGQVLRFSTKTRAVAFLDKWNQVEVNTGGNSLTFHRVGPHHFEPV